VKLAFVQYINKINNIIIRSSIVQVYVNARGFNIFNFTMIFLISFGSKANFGRLVTYKFEKLTCKLVARIFKKKRSTLMGKLHERVRPSCIIQSNLLEIRFYDIRSV
jgi:hypothetical protein